MISWGDPMHSLRAVVAKTIIDPPYYDEDNDEDNDDYYDVDVDENAVYDDVDDDARVYHLQRRKRTDSVY